MYSLLLLTALPGQFVESEQFPLERQHAAFDATARIYHPASRSEGAAVVVGQKADVTYLLTAAHLVPERHAKDRENVDLRNVELYFYSHKRPDRVTIDGVIATVQARLPKRDLAVLAAKLKAHPSPIPLCPGNKLIFKLPMKVMTVGVIPDSAPDIKLDTVREKPNLQKPDGTDGLYWEADIPQGRGRSGGPMIDTRGYVIGIASGIQHGKGYYAAIDEIRRGLKDAGFEWLCP